jgi:cysteine desulfurase
MNREVYLDNSATTRPYDDVLDYMNYVNKNTYGNPSSLHTKGIEAEKLVKKARSIIAQSIDVESKDIYFTSGGTESNNLAILGYLKANPRKRKHIITTKIEHPSVLEVFKYLEGEGYRADYIDVDKDGVILLDMLMDKINEDTALISVMYVNNETGTIQPIEEIARIRNIRNNDTVLHVDAVQAYGKLKIKPEKLGIDLMTFSSHKIHGPKGVGALFSRKGIRIQPIIWGGGQELSIRSGTENVPGICGFGLSADITHNNIDKSLEKVTKLKRMFAKLLRESIEEEEYEIISPENSSPYIINVSFNNIKAEVLLHHLGEKSIFVSTGSACSSRKTRHSHVLQAMGVSPQKIDGAIRFSFSAENEKEDVITTIKALKEILPKIRISNIHKKL